MGNISNLLDVPAWLYLGCCNGYITNTDYKLLSNFCQAASECKCVQLSVFLLLCFLLFWFVCNWSAIYLYHVTNASSVRRCWASILHWAQHNWGFPLVAKSWKMFNFRLNAALLVTDTFLPSCAITAEKGRDKYHKDRIIPLVSVYPCLYQMTSSDYNIIDRENNALKNITFAMWHVHQESSHQLLLWIFCIIATEVFKTWKNSKVLTSQPSERFIIVCVHKCLCLDVFTKYILLENT